MQKGPLQIGVTGGIGSGKSLVCKVFSCLGVPIYEADVRAKWLTNHDPEIKAAIISLLGSAAYDREGVYNRNYVASQVFTDKDLLSKLNAIIHPKVAMDTEAWLTNHAGEAYVIKEAALMKAAGEGNKLDFVVVVDAPEAIRVHRILKRDNRSEAEITAIISRQISDNERKMIADFTINNSGTQAIIPQVWFLHQQFIELANRGRIAK